MRLRDKLRHRSGLMAARGRSGIRRGRSEGWRNGDGGLRLHHARHGLSENQNDPDWFDVLRPTKLPSFENEFGDDGHWFASVRQTRFGVKTSTPTGLGDLKTQFEFEMFGTGVDAGQTTIRLRHAYGELGQFGAGQTWSPFMDIDVFPNSVEYWGPTGMAFFRNVQVRWMPIKGDTRMTIALERPGASADQGDFADRIELQDVKGTSRIRISPPSSAGRRLGLRRGRRHRALHGVGRQRARSDRSVRRRHGLGRQPELQYQVRQIAFRTGRRCTAKAFRTT